MKRAVALILALVGMLLLFAGCGSGGHTYDFITIMKTDNTQGIKLGVDRLSLEAVVGNRERDSGIWRKYEDKTYTKSIAFIFGSKSYMMAGSGFNTNTAKADVLPYYQKDPSVTVVENGEKLTFSKVIDNVTYYVTYRFYPDGTVHFITIYDPAKYTDDDAAYEGNDYT